MLRKTRKPGKSPKEGGLEKGRRGRLPENRWISNKIRSVLDGRAFQSAHGIAPDAQEFNQKNARAVIIFAAFANCAKKRPASFFFGD